MKKATSAISKYVSFEADSARIAFALLCVGLLVGLGVWRSVYSQRRTWQTLVQQEQVLRAQYRALYARLPDIAAYERALRERTQQWEAVRHVWFSPSEALPDMLDAVTHVGDAVGVRFQSFTPLGSYDRDLWREIAWRVVLTATYGEAIRFIRGLMDLRPGVSVHEFTFSVSSGDVVERLEGVHLQVELLLKGYVERV